METNLISAVVLCTALSNIYQTAYTKAEEKIPYEDLEYSINQSYKGSDEGYKLIITVVASAYYDQLHNENHKDEVYSNCVKEVEKSQQPATKKILT